MEFEVVNEPPQGSFIAMYENTKTNNYFKKKTLVKGINKLTFRNNTEYNAFGCTIKEDLQIRNVKFYKEDFNVGYKTEYNISEMESRIEQTKNQIEHAVKEDDFGTLLTQNAYHLRLAWNNISKFIQFEYGDIAFYEKGEITESKLTAKLTDTGYQFWRDGYHLGNMGANRYIGDESKKGIVFDLEYDGWFMGWGYKKTRDANQYTWKWLYSSGSFASYDANTLNAGCDIDMHWNKLKKAAINLDEISIQHTITSGFHFALPTSFTSDGRASEWSNGCYLEFKNGILINATMPQ